MTKRVILKVPEGLEFTDLTEEQQTAIRNIFGQYVNPMPGTIAADGWQIVDALTNDSFDPALTVTFFPDWDILALWGSDKEILVPMDWDAFLPHLPDTHTYDDEGNILTTTPATPHLPHGWAGATYEV